MIALLKRRASIFPTFLKKFSKNVRYQTWLALTRVFQNETTETNILKEAKEDNQYFNLKKAMMIVMMMVMVDGDYDEYDHQGHDTLMTCVKVSHFVHL